MIMSAPASNHYVGRLGSEGAYDDFEFVDYRHHEAIKAPVAV